MLFVEILIRDIASVLAAYIMPDLKIRRAAIENLIFLYHTMKASENLLRVAADKSKDDEILFPYYTKHALEEYAHDVWLANDLASVGVDVKQTQTPFLAVEMCGSLYYLINHIDSAALFGYLALMEGSPTSLESLNELERLHGKDLYRTLRYHVEHDVDHSKEMGVVMEQLNDNRKALIREVGIRSAHYFGQAMAAIARNTNQAINTVQI